MPVQRHNVIIPTVDGGVEVYPLKEWLRQHPDETPPGLDPTSSTSHQLRNGLRRLGWTMHETPTEVRLIKPGLASDPEIANKILGNDETANNETDEPSFTLEHQLRDFLASNLGTVRIAEKRLRLFVDPTGRDGIEFPTAVGPIDILATDDEGSFFVFELKRASGGDKAIGQLARYMGWVQQTIGKGRNVSGIIVARSINENLRYAASIVPNVHLFEYGIEFHLHPAHELKQA